MLKSRHIRYTYIYIYIYIYISLFCMIIVTQVGFILPKFVIESTKVSVHFLTFDFTDLKFVTEVTNFKTQVFYI
jgi:hypothetical protein